jgi:chitin-binding protein
VVRIAVAFVPLLFVALVAEPAGAHGALTSPVSRVAACGPEGAAQYRDSAACAAARAASGGGQLDWDNLRLPNVNGRDRQMVPDGKLCSAGLDRFKGLDLPRTDWPTTTLAAGAAFTFAYRTTIPHEGTFRLYVTKPGYSPTKPLRWADLESTAFLTVKDPPVRGGAYTMSGRLPSGRQGRHLIYTIWQNSSTPDTYYSCSDVTFGAAAGAAAGTSVGSSPPASAGPSAAAGASGDPDAAVAATSALPPAPSGGTPKVIPIAGGGLALVAAVGLAIVLRRRRLRPPHRGRRWAS